MSDKRIRFKEDNTGLPFLWKGKTLVIDADSGEEIGTVEEKDEWGIGGIFGQKNTVIKLTDKKSLTGEENKSSPTSVSEHFSSGTSSVNYSGGSSYSGSSGYSPTGPLRLRTKLAIGVAAIFFLGSLAIEYIHPHRAYSVFKAVDDVAEFVQKPFQKEEKTNPLEEKVGSGGTQVGFEENPPATLLENGKHPYHPSCVGEERTREVGEWNDGKPHCQGYQLGKWNDKKTHPNLKESTYFCWNPADDGTNCGKNKVCLEGLCRRDL
jgi:hypothetical protein